MMIKCYSVVTLYDPMECNSPGVFVHGILQVRILEWVAIPFSRGFPDPGNEPRSPALQVDSLPLSHLWSPINYDRFIKWNAIFWLKSGNNEVSIHSCCLITKSCPTLCDPMDPRLPHPSLSPGVCPTLCPLTWWCYPTISPTGECLNKL